MAKDLINDSRQVVENFCQEKNWKFKEEDNLIYIGFKSDDQKNIFIIVISIEEDGNFIQLMSILNVNDKFLKRSEKHYLEFCLEILNINFEKKLVKLGYHNEKGKLVCYVDMFIGSDGQLTNEQLDRLFFIMITNLNEIYNNKNIKPYLEDDYE
ncbi:YbjN domain-containing protein [Neisseria sp.]|uniref:YbjN domain-containing protein n=1 Tax=Neisseria sp. TaxID=192066 RepID=UPI0026DAF933|nr:YbjN domain-containing protein [Neisseria sp.]MDO4227689.1 YbjN domain-containing protein [Neisseria sp.]